MRDRTVRETRPYETGPYEWVRTVRAVRNRPEPDRTDRVVRGRAVGVRTSGSRGGAADHPDRSGVGAGAGGLAGQRGDDEPGHVAADPARVQGDRGERGSGQPGRRDVVGP